MNYCNTKALKSWQKWENLHFVVLVLSLLLHLHFAPGVKIASTSTSKAWPAVCNIGNHCKYECMAFHVLAFVLHCENVTCACTCIFAAGPKQPLALTRIPFKRASSFWAHKKWYFGLILFLAPIAVLLSAHIARTCSFWVCCFQNYYGFGIKPVRTIINAMT